MTSPRRLLVVTPLPRSVSGGIEEYAYSIADALRVRGDVVKVLTTRYDLEAEGDAESATVAVLDAKEILGRPVCSRFRSYLRIVRLVRRADVVHVHMPFPFVEALVALLARLMGKPVVVTYHMDAVVDDPDAGAPGNAHRTAERLYRFVSAVPTVTLADRVCTNSQEYARHSKVLQSRIERVQVVHQGVDANKVSTMSPAAAETVRRALLGDRYEQLACFVGRLVPYKGLDVLLEAIERLDRRRTLFVIGGRGPEEEHLRRTIDERGLSNTQMLGYIPDAELLNLFRAADVVVSPSVSMLESTPITLLYARAVGTPVIGTDVGGTGETVPNDGQGGLVIPARDPVALAEALERLLDLRSGKVPEVRPRFWSDVANDYAGIIDHLGGVPSLLAREWTDPSSAAYGSPSEPSGGK